MLHSSQPARGFTQSEFEQRTALVQAQMSARSLAGILLCTEPEVRYFSGFQTQFWQSPTRPWFLFLPASGKPVAIIPGIGAELMQSTWLDDIRCWSAPAPDDDGISLLVDLLSPLADERASIGLMKGHETHLRMPLADYERLLAQLPGLHITDVSTLIQQQRMIKSPAELAKLSCICAIGSAAFAQLPELVHVGLPLQEVFRRFRIAALQQGADDVPYLVGGADRDGYADVISPPSARPLQQRDILMLDTGCIRDGYHCDFDRNWAIGSAHDTARRAYDVLWRATEAGLAAAVAGNSCRDLFTAMSGVIAEMDNSGGDIGRLGHGLGMQLTEQPSHAAFDNTELKPGMVLTLEPSLSYGAGKMMVHEEDIVITDAGAKLLTERAPLALPVI